MTRRSVAVMVLLLLLLLGLGFWFRPGQLEPRFYSSSTPAYIPTSADSFATYVQENRSRIRSALAEYFYQRETWPFGAGYTMENVVNMRAPYELAPDTATCGEGDGQRGFLLIHGLSDSPYLLRNVAASIAGQYPCALIRGLLTPGHGTVPGDLLMANREDWTGILRWAVDGMAASVEQLYLVGYSNGAALALNYLDENPDQQLIAGIILLSPGLEVKDPLIHLAPYLRFVRAWISRHGDLDAVKYESFPTRAAAEFYRLTQQINRPGLPGLATPVMMVISGDDTTVNAQSALRYFCARAVGPRLALWYQSSTAESRPAQNCAGLEILQASDPDSRFVSHSHVAITMPPSDGHYGVNGHYVNCLSYPAMSDERQQCEGDDSASVYGEGSLLDETGRYQGKFLRRATYNPHYQEMMQRVFCFIDGNCGQE